jgi:hypothetical protein
LFNNEKDSELLVMMLKIIEGILNCNMDRINEFFSKEMMCESVRYLKMMRLVVGNICKIIKE